MQPDEAALNKMFLEYNGVFAGDLVIYDDDTSKIVAISKNEIQIQNINKEDETKVNFVRINKKKLPKEVKLEKGLYTLKFRNKERKIEVLDDSTILYLNYRIDYHFNFKKYKIVNFSGANFLYINDFFQTSYLVTGIDSNSVDLRMHYKKTDEIELVKEETDSKKCKLIGKWIQDTSYNFSPFPFPACSQDSPFELNFQKDSLFISYCGYKKNLAWNVNSSYECIYFSEDYNHNLNYIRIIGCSENYLSIKRFEQKGFSYDKSYDYIQVFLKRP